MKIKDESVECQFHWHLINFLLTKADPYYAHIGGELIITSGSESGARHGYTSLHYALPGCAVDIRSWDIVDQQSQVWDASYQVMDLKRNADEYCEFYGLNRGTIEVIQEETHIHIEFQPKRGD